MVCGAEASNVGGIWFHATRPVGDFISGAERVGDANDVTDQVAINVTWWYAQDKNRADFSRVAEIGHLDLDLAAIHKHCSSSPSSINRLSPPSSSS